VSGFSKGIFVTFIYIGKGLRISVEQWKPATLDLDHQTVSFLKAMVYVWKIELDPGDFLRQKGFRVFKTIAVLSPEDITTY